MPPLLAEAKWTRPGCVDVSAVVVEELEYSFEKCNDSGDFDPTILVQRRGGHEGVGDANDVGLAFVNTAILPISSVDGRGTHSSRARGRGSRNFFRSLADVRDQEPRGDDGCADPNEPRLERSVSAKALAE
ncbi:hypothetical protein LPJ72_005711, partial [Coemansia sp. Benny D160-2]